MSKGTVGFLGLGAMGDPMVRMLLSKGWHVLVAPRDPAKADGVVAAGAELVADPAAIAARTQLVVTCVSDGHAVEDVLFGSRGLLAGGRWEGGLIADCTTTRPAEARAIADRLAAVGAAFLDAPVSGGPRGATQGTLSIMVGGRAEDLERARPVLEAMGSRVIHCGDQGAGQVTKACNQLIVMSTVTAVAEALRLAANAGLDPWVVREVLLGGYAYSPILEMHGIRMLTGDYAPGGRAIFHAKDIATIAEIAGEKDLDLPLFDAVRAQFERLFAMPGGPDLDHSAVALLYPVPDDAPASPPDAPGRAG